MSKIVKYLKEAKGKGIKIKFLMISDNKDIKTELKEMLKGEDTEFTVMSVKSLVEMISVLKMPHGTSVIPLIELKLLYLS